MILYVNELTFQNRHEVLHEVGITKNRIDMNLLFKYITVVNKNVSFLMSNGYFPDDFDVQQKLCDCFEDIHVTPSDLTGNMPLKALRQEVLNKYLSIKLKMTKKENEKMWTSYSRVKHKSFRSVQKMMNILINDLNFSNERIIKNVFLLYGDPENLETILKTIPTIGGEDVKQVLYSRPKIIMTSASAIRQCLDHLKSFNIPEQAITRCTELLTLGPDTVLERLKDLNNVDEFQALITNPRVLRLVHYQSKARLRLDYLQHLKVRCASLHILSCSANAFAKFAREGSDRTKGRDIIFFLVEKLKKDPSEIREQLSRHPNWCHVPAVQAKQCYEYLISKKFKKIDIFHNMHVLLYPIARIDEKLKMLQNNDAYHDMNLNVNYTQVSNRQLLTLVLYIIESEYHFTGDGVWNESHVQPMENFNNLLPDFPEGYQKIYKQPPISTESQRFNIL
ncbi:hypothetical protein ACFFRR_000517 [Megaselia abdita]